MEKEKYYSESFGSGGDNPHGLALKFSHDSTGVRAEFTKF